MINHLNTNSLHQSFRQTTPFPYVIIDNFLDPQQFERISNEMSEYYDKNKDKGKSWNSDVESGKWGSTELKLPPGLKDLDNFLKSQDFLATLEKISGFKNLKVTKNINGAGFSFFHAMKPNGFLGPHTDHTRDLDNGPYHVLNIIIYMAKDWNPNWGGGTTIYNKRIKLQSDIEYRSNRAIIFMHSPFSIHGTQKISPLAEGHRYSIYYDYYTEDNAPFAHLGMNDIKLINSPHLFYFPRFSDYLKKENRRYLKMHMANIKNTILGK